MPVAIPIAAAAVGAAGKIASAKMAGSAAKKQAKKATAAQAAQTAANTALSKDVYKTNVGLFAPSAVQGQQAGNVLMSMLLGNSYGAGGGGGGAGAQPAPSALAAYQPPDAAAQLEYLLHGSTDTIGPKRTRKINAYQGTPEQKLQYAQALLHPGERTQYNAYLSQQEQAAQPSIYEAAGLGANGMGNSNPSSAMSAFDQFRNSNDYQWRLNEANRAVANNFASDFESPAAQIALQDRGVHMANAEMGNWMNMLAQQQGIGLNSAGNIANQGNTMYGQISGTQQDATNAKMNQYGVAAQAAGNTWKAVGSGIGQVAGAVGGAFGGGAGAAANAANSAGGYSGGMPMGGTYNLPGGGIYDYYPGQSGTG